MVEVLVMISMHRRCVGRIIYRNSSGINPKLTRVFICRCLVIVLLILQFERDSVVANDLSRDRP